MTDFQSTSNSLLERLARFSSGTGSIRPARTGPAVSSSSAVVETLESRLMLTIVGVSGAWSGGVFDHIGIFEDGAWQLDDNGDGMVGDSPAFVFGQPGDTPIAGDWDGDGFHSVGVHRGNTFFLDTDEDRRLTANDVVVQFGQVGDVPVVGNWTGIGGDKIGVFRDGTWLLDANADGVFGAGDITAQFGQAGDTPVTGNWNITVGDGIGVFRNGVWSIDRNENLFWDGGNGDQAVAFGSGSDQPFTGDFINDNDDEVAVFQDPPGGNPVFFFRDLDFFGPPIMPLADVTTPTGSQAIAITAEDDRSPALAVEDERRDELFATSDEFF